MKSFLVALFIFFPFAGFAGVELGLNINVIPYLERYTTKVQGGFSGSGKVLYAMPKIEFGFTGTVGSLKSFSGPFVDLGIICNRKFAGNKDTYGYLGFGASRFTSGKMPVAGSGFTAGLQGGFCFGTENVAFNIEFGPRWAEINVRRHPPYSLGYYEYRQSMLLMPISGGVRIRL